MENMADAEGFVTQELIDLYRDLSLGQAGLIITGAAAVDRSGRLWPRQISVWDDKFIDGLKKVAEAIHQGDKTCKCAVQLHHSGMPGYGYSYGISQTPFALNEATDQEICAIVIAFGAAALRVKSAGFDAVAVHAAHGYLVSQFLSPATNMRTDRWGGSPEKRMRFALEVCRAIKEKTDGGTPLLWKMNCADFQPGGQGLKEYAAMAKKFVDEGVDLIELSGGLKDQIHLRGDLKEQAGAREVYFRTAIQPFRNAIGDKTLAVTGGIRSGAIMEELLHQGADLIGLSRPLIIEPDLPNQLFQSTHAQIQSKCTSCNLCLLRIADKPLRCLQNWQGVSSDC